MRNRGSILASLAEGHHVPVLIVGGGINGCGILRDLAAQGVPALLVDRGDIGGGTSAASSRLIHGGLRYLETGEFKLVRESVAARDTLLRNAPHLVRPIPTWVPVTSWTGGALAAAGRVLGLVRTPGRKGAIPLALGLSLYDRFSRETRAMPRHRFLRAAAARHRLPGLAAGIRIVGEYHDARVTHPERLTLELVADAEHDCAGAAALPYVALQGVAGSDMILRDQITHGTIRVRPDLVVNAAGAWVDQVEAALGTNERLMGGTKGSHLVVRDPRLAGQLGEHMLYFETVDHRACLVYALDAAHLLLGTTDLRTADPDDRACSDAEITYLFGVLDAVLPGHGLGARDVVFSYAGVRPLPRSKAGATGAISRDHRLVRHEGGPIPRLTLVGGKWTTYRECAAEVTDAVLAQLGRARRTGTDRLPIGGGRDWPDGGAPVIAAALSRDLGIAPDRAATLARRYGTRAADVAQEAARRPGDHPLRTAPAYTTGEIAWLADASRVTRLEDLILRRTLLGFEGLASRAVATEIAETVAPSLGWDEAAMRAEIEATCAVLAARHGVADDAATPVREKVQV